MEMEGTETTMTDKIDSKFRYVLVAAQRAEQLMRGARPKVEATKRKHTRVAMQEVESDLIDWNYGPAPAEEPAPEAQEAPADEVH